LPPNTASLSKGGAGSEHASLLVLSPPCLSQNKQGIETTLRQPMALREHFRNVDKNLKTRNWKGISSVWIKHRRNPLISLSRRKFGLKRCFFLFLKVLICLSLF
jgi:hypothetical protein